MSDQIKISINEDGVIKMETDKVSAANHSNAEGFLRHIVSLAGGKVKRVMKPGAHAHSHTHGGVTTTHTH